MVSNEHKSIKQSQLLTHQLITGEIPALRRKRLEKRNILREIYDDYRDKLGLIQDKLCEDLRHKSSSENVYKYSFMTCSFTFKRHPNGGGWVQDTCIVPNEIHLSENVVVLGKVRILPSANIGKNATVGYLGMRKRLNIEGKVV